MLRSRGSEVNAIYFDETKIVCACADYKLKIWNFHLGDEANPVKWWWPRKCAPVRITNSRFGTFILGMRLFQGNESINLFQDRPFSVCKICLCKFGTFTSVMMRLIRANEMLDLSEQTIWCKVYLCGYGTSTVAMKIRPKIKKVFDWRNPTDPRYPADPRYLY